MNSTEHAHELMVANKCKAGVQIREELNPLDCHVLHMVIGISGEAGELLDTIKKSAIYRKPYDIENITEELGDLEFYIAGLRMALGLKRDVILQQNIDKLEKRYGQKYSNQAAQARADKQG